jgi:uncharacterized protein (UPF0548 family)
MILLGSPSEVTLRRLWTASVESDFSYTAIGATARGRLPARYRHDRREVTLGSDKGHFDRAVQALQSWQMHVRSGFTIFPHDQNVAVGQTVLVIIQKGPLAVVAPCRVVHSIDEADRFGFAYGTLPGHPEQGEEMFVVERSSDNVVRFTVTAFSRPQELLVRLAGPISRWIQERATVAYVDAMRELSDGV